MVKHEEHPMPTKNDSVGPTISMVSVWLDKAGGGRDATAHLFYRVTKVCAEAGEVHDALEGYVGWNPRKGKTHELTDVQKELLDVAVSALCAYEHTDGNQGRCMLAFEEHIHGVAERAGLVKERPCGENQKASASCYFTSIDT
jgi:NTP pyrophosphatase (non-canonical NTP hydrolase)